MRGRPPLLLVPLLVATLLLASPGVASANTTYRDKMFAMVNARREAHGLRPLKLDTVLSGDAWKHSVRMAQTGTIFHTTTLQTLISSRGGSVWGEDVGMAGTLKRLMRLFMHSAEHRANILGKAFTHIGVGVVRTKGAYWVTLDFYG